MWAESKADRNFSPFSKDGCYRFAIYITSVIGACAVCAVLGAASVQSASKLGTRSLTKLIALLRCKERYAPLNRTADGLRKPLACLIDVKDQAPDLFALQELKPCPCCLPFAVMIHLRFSDVSVPKRDKVRKLRKRQKRKKNKSDPQPTYGGTGKERLYGSYSFTYSCIFCYNGWG